MVGVTEVGVTEVAVEVAVVTEVEVAVVATEFPRVSVPRKFPVVVPKELPQA